MIDGATREDVRVHIRWMMRRDMPEVLDIEFDGFEFPWTEEDFLLCLRQRNCIRMVAEHDRRVVGFMLYELHTKRIHLLNFAVACDYRRRGVGRQMAERLISKITPQRRSRILVHLSETNLGGQLFFRAMGFRGDAVLRNFYAYRNEDAYVMVYRARYANKAADPARRDF